ncbi:hypothetical protein [Streptomyces sp. NPDC000410]|uniref:hypothetical protein n=1 Tax=Streptomyces sp. NPDC000410 TaxID=3154254 RepID=UPI00331CF356
MKTRLAALGTLTLMAVASQASGVAYADETHTNSHNGHSVTLIKTGQIDDPLEDVLEHATILGRTVMSEPAEAAEPAEPA